MNYKDRQITNEEIQGTHKHTKILNLSNNYKLLKRILKNNEMPFHPLRQASTFKSLNWSARDVWEFPYCHQKHKLSSTILENNLKIIEFKDEHMQTCDLVIPFTGIHTRGTLTCTHKIICWWILTAILLITHTHK